MTARHEPPDDEIDFQEGVDPDTIRRALNKGRDHVRTRAAA